MLAIIMWVVLWIMVGRFITGMLGAIFGGDSPEIKFGPPTGSATFDWPGNHGGVKDVADARPRPRAGRT
jgi:hypothetical protein